MLKYLAAAAVAALTAGSAQAAVVFDVDVVFRTMTGGGPLAGTLKGRFTTTDDLSTVTDFDLTASSFGAFAGFRYTTANSSVTASVLPSQFFQIDSTGNVNELRLYFTAPLTRAGGTLSPVFSYESEPSGGIRSPVGAVTPQATAVPEPASWAMMIAGAGAVGFALRRRRKPAVTVRFA